MNNSEALQPYQNKLTELNKQIIYLTGQRDTQTLSANNYLKEYKEAEGEIIILKEVINFFSTTIDDQIEEVKHTVEDIINKGLKFIFGSDAVGITLSTEFKNNKTQFVISLTDGKSTSQELADSFGGGLVSCVAFLFKIVIAIIHKNEKFMVFDETVNFVSVSLQPNLSLFIKQLCKDMSVTLVLITHQKVVSDSADIVYEAYDAGNSTKFKRYDQAKVEEKSSGQNEEEV